jgi:hypothetical protein
MRQALPYKAFPKIESEARGADAKAVPVPPSSADIPPNGNKHVDERDWTEAERKKVDSALKAHARWEVAYTDRYIKSTHCEGTTVNVSQVCDNCQSMARDESLKRAVRLVGDRLSHLLELTV